MTPERALLAAGVRFARADGRVSARGPATVDLRAEVAARVPLVRARLRGAPSADGGARWGACDTCGGAMEKHRSGACWLCDCALQKVRDAREWPFGGAR